MPYFIEIDMEKDGSQNQVVYDEYEKLIKSKLPDVGDKGAIVDGAENIPDGMVYVYGVNDETFKYKIQVNDQPYYQYHKNNGITKLGFL